MHNDPITTPGIKRPTVSVIIPLFNKVDFVARAVASVLGQEFCDFELLVVDDGSTDNSVAQLDSFASDRRLRIIRQANAGVSAARNRGMAETRGELIAFLDADDEWLPKHLGLLRDLSDRFPDAALFATLYYLCRGDRMQVAAQLPAHEAFQVRSYFDFVMQYGQIINSSTSAIRRRVYRKLDGFLENVRYGEDQEYWARIALNYAVAFDPQISALYRVGMGNSAMNLYSWKPEIPPVVTTVCQFTNQSGERHSIADGEAYAAYVLLNHIAVGIVIGAHSAARNMLDHPLLRESKFQHRKQVLSIASRLPVWLIKLYAWVRKIEIRMGKTESERKVPDRIACFQ